VPESTVQSRPRRTVSDETRRSFCQQWFPQRGPRQASVMLAALDRSLWEFREGASSCRPTSGCKHAAGAEIDNPYASVHVLPVSSSLVCPKFLGPHRGLPCQCFPSLVERRELCRCRSGSANVAGLTPCPICVPSLPSRYALGVGERCGLWPASQWRAILPLRVRPHQQLALSSSALPHEPISQVLSCEAP
jgi:hypothetical protein